MIYFLKSILLWSFIILSLEFYLFVLRGGKEKKIWDLEMNVCEMKILCFCNLV